MISIIVPIYNVENYLERCINSLLCQTYENLEIILVDDGSKDNSGVICDTYAGRDRRVKVIHKENGGVSSARNAGLDVAQGQFVAFVDGDDWVESNMFQIMRDNIREYRTDCVFCSYFYARDDGKNKKVLQPATGIVNREDALKQLLLATKDHSGYNGFPWNKLTRRDMIGELRFDTSISVGEDVLFFVDVLNRCKTVYLNPTPLYYYYQREGSACHTRRLGITQQRLDNIQARVLLGRKVEQTPALYAQVKVDMFAVGVRILADAYALGDRKAEQELLAKLQGSYRYYFRAKSYTNKRKIFSTVIYLCVLFRLPKNIVSKLMTLF